MAAAAAAAASAAPAASGWASAAQTAGTIAAAGTQSLGMIGGLQNLFGGARRRKKLQKEQISMQGKLNEQAAATNYQYGEKAAENAFERQMEAYRTELKDNSPEAVKERFKAAGMNPVTAMGAGGAGAGGAGHMTTQPQPTTGGAQAGHADTAIEMQMAQMQITRMGLEMANIAKQGKVLDAQATDLTAGAEQKKATTEKTGTETDLNKLEAESKKMILKVQEAETPYEIEAAGFIYMNKFNEALENAARAEITSYDEQAYRETYEHRIRKIEEEARAVTADIVLKYAEVEKRKQETKNLKTEQRHTAQSIEKIKADTALSRKERWKIENMVNLEFEKFNFEKGEKLNRGTIEKIFQAAMGVIGAGTVGK